MNHLLILDYLKLVLFTFLTFEKYVLNSVFFLIGRRKVLLLQPWQTSHEPRVWNEAGKQCPQKPSSGTTSEQPANFRRPKQRDNKYTGTQLHQGSLQGLPHDRKQRVSPTRTGHARIREIWVAAVGACRWPDVVDSFCAHNLDHDLRHLNARATFAKR